MSGILNWGPPLERLVENTFTPNSLFFARNHAPAPCVDPETFRLTVEGKVRRPKEWSLAELQARFREVELPATLVCAGNRRSEISALAPIDDQLNWGAEAVGSAIWAGFRLADVLAASEPDAGAGHVAFLGLDQVIEPAWKGGEPFPYGSSIPLDKALSRETLLATRMNGAPLPARHGFPLRVVVPGYIGARSVKWVARISVQDEPSDNYFQQVAYKLYPVYAAADGAGRQPGLMLGEFAVNSVIALPAPGSRLKAGAVTLRGYAFAGGARTVARVDVSSDGGRNWQAAELLGASRPYLWRLWRASIELAPGEHTLAARAVDDAANSQPERVETVWNFKGYANNAWHRVRVTAE